MYSIILYYLFFSVDNLNKSTNGTNSDAANDESGIYLYVWV